MTNDMASPKLISEDFFFFCRTEQSLLGCWKILRAPHTGEIAYTLRGDAFRIVIKILL
jgi:hypothetical protein